MLNGLLIFLVGCLILAVVIWVVKLLLDMLSLPEQVKQILMVIIALIVLIIIVILIMNVFRVGSGTGLLPRIM